MKTHHDKRWTRDIITIFPGELVVSRDSIITTVLGTCVAVVLYSLQDKIGGMNHFMLPQSTRSSVLPLDQSQEGRYGVYAMELLINALLKEGIPKSRLSAKVFGGGKMFISTEGANPHHIGIQNVIFIQEFLSTEKIPLVSEDVTGSGARRIYFFPWNGKVLLKRYQRTEQGIMEIPGFMQREETLREKLKEPRETRVVLFDQFDKPIPPDPRE